MGYNLGCSKSYNANFDTDGRTQHLCSVGAKKTEKDTMATVSLFNGDFYVDSMFSTVKNSQGFTGVSVYTNGLGYDRFYPWQSKGQHADTIMRFIHDVGVPQTLINNNAKEEVKGRAKATCDKY
jgi:hypothetical protein